MFDYGVYVFWKGTCWVCVAACGAACACELAMLWVVHVVCSRLSQSGWECTVIACVKEGLQVCVWG